MDNKTYISSQSLKRVILQLDFSGLMEESLVEWVTKKRKDFSEVFARFDRAERGSVRLDISHPERFSMESGPDVKEVNRGTLFLFQEGSLKDLKDILRLEISNHRIVLTVNCLDYDSSIPYREYICELWESLSDHDRFVRFESMGLRKLDLFDFKDEKELLDNISPMAMNFDLWNKGHNFHERTFTDRYIFDATETRATILDYIRHLRFVLKGVEEYGRIQVIVDMDCRHYDKINIRPGKEELMAISTQMNDKLYSFFEGSVTTHYIRNHEK